MSGEATKEHGCNSGSIQINYVISIWDLDGTQAYAVVTHSFVVSPLTLLARVIQTVACRVGEHEHRLAHQCSPCENIAHT